MLIRKATANMSNIQSQKYGYPLEAIKENTIRSEKYRDIYDFYRTLKAQKHPRADMKNDKLLCRRLRELLKVGERMFALAERLKRKGAPKHLHE